MVLMIVEYFPRVWICMTFYKTGMDSICFDIHLFLLMITHVCSYFCQFVTIPSWISNELQWLCTFFCAYERFLVIFNIQDQWQLWSLGRSLSYARCGKLSKTIPNMIPAWSKSDQEIIPKWSRSHPKIIPNSSRHDPKDIPKWFQSHLPKLSESHLKIVSKSSKSDAKHTNSHWFFYRLLDQLFIYCHWLFIDNDLPFGCRMPPEMVQENKKEAQK